MTTAALPRAFIWRRLHSLTGLFFTLFLVEHLLVNSQAALFFGDDGSGFVEGVNAIHNLPYLPIIEFFLLGVPILIHMGWGIVYIRTGQSNVFKNDGTVPYLPEYPRNQAYTWQRITAWILLFGVIAHVVHMRFVELPDSVKIGSEKLYLVKVDLDDGLYTLSSRLGVKLYDHEAIEGQKEVLLLPSLKTSDPADTLQHFIVSLKDIFQKPKKKEGPDDKGHALLEAQERQHQRQWLTALEKNSLAPGQVIAVAPDFGTAELLVVRETFKSPLMIALYTIFVLTACYHGFNGLWTFMISWGVTLSANSQAVMRSISTVLMVLVTFMGLAAIWATYFINLKS